MRLLHFPSESEVRLAEFYGKEIPPYAILSHTWGADHEEVTFKDLENDTYKSKPGFSKIRFCKDQAFKTELSYFWVDTCCIDKSSSPELQEAINSMYKWYSGANRCCVYLSDVSVGDCFEKDQETWKQAFRSSRWFTRGWTLQELLAPERVEFFSVEGKYLGAKSSLEKEIHEITGIPVAALRGSPMSQFDIKERMAWAENRKTKREEDAAYSLLGIFGIFMPLLYGEGKWEALERLRRKIKKRQTNDPYAEKPMIMNRKLMNIP